MQTLADTSKYTRFHLVPEVLRGALPPFSDRYLLYGVVRVLSNDVFPLSSSAGVCIF